MAERLRQQQTRDILIVVAAVLLLTLPFINKAFDWDDREFIEFAQVFEQDPLEFHLEDLGYRGEFYEEFRTTHPPVISWYLSLFLRLGIDVSEAALRLAMIIFPLIAGVSMYSLGKRFTGYPLAAALLLLVTPGFIVTSHTLMGDTPGLALWLAAVAFYIWGVDKDSWKLLLAAGLVMALAVLTAYQALSLIPLLLFYTLVKRRFRLRSFVPFLLPVLVFGVYTLYLQQKYGAWPRFSYSVGLDFGWRDPSEKIRAILAFVGGGIIFPLAVIPLVRKKIDLLLVFLLLPPLLTWAIFYYLASADLTVYQSLWLALLVTAGFFLLFRILSEPVTNIYRLVRRRGGSSDTLFLLAWFAGVAFYVGVFLPFVSARFLLPLFPAVVLFFLQEVDRIWPSSTRARTLYISATVVLTLMTGIAVAAADYRLAGSGRSAAEDISAKYGGDDGKLWVLSEFGFRYYMQQQGFEYLAVNAEASPGDLVVMSRINSDQVLAPLPEGFYDVVERIDLEDRYPVRMLNREAGAGFYAHLVGPLPFIVANDPVDEITVFRLKWEE